MVDRKKDFDDGYYKTTNKNHAVLVEADKIGWKKATKTKGMFARKLEKDVVVNSIEGPLNAKKGNFLCMGFGGEFWVQKEANVLKKYDDEGPFKKSVKVKYADGEKVTYTDFHVFKPKPDREVLVCHMPNSFEVHASWGDLNGKKGDYMVKPLEDGLDPDPQDVWLVDKELFEATYEIKHWL
tara:strand:- start:85 stop:630 length:546 start_codon:yes stop_codon:yes gene_type:complete